MGSFVVRRMLLGIVVLFIVTIFIFFLMYSLPGDIAMIMLGEEATLEEIEALRAELWLDKPAIVQYGHWLGNAFHGDLGRSVMYHDQVTGLIAERLPVTLYLAIPALIIGVSLGIGAGIVCSIRRGGMLDTVVTLLANIGIAFPIFWLGVAAIYLFGLTLGWLPIQGYVSPFDDPWLSIQKAIMPVTMLAIPGLAVFARQTRSSMLEIIRQDYIRTAWSKGLTERIIVYKHALKNAFIPVITLMGSSVRTLIGGSVIIETVYNIPGIGRLLVSSVFDKDFTVVQGVIFVMAVMVLLINLLVDISYGWLDPRIHYD